MILNKLKDFVGITEHDDFEEEYEEVNWQQAPAPLPTAPVQEEVSPPRRAHREPLTLTNNEPTLGTGARNNVIGMPGISNSIAEVVVVEPHSFEEMPQVIKTLKERKSVVLNLNVMDPEEAQRAVDFVAGGTFAIDGHQERIGESIFLFTPSCVKVSSIAGTVNEITEATQAPLRSTPIPSNWGLEAGRLAQ